METSMRIIDYHLKRCMGGGFLKITLSGRNKRNFPLSIFQKEPMGRINEFTYQRVRIGPH
jgi:hypothetical protein